MPAIRAVFSALLATARSCCLLTAAYASNRNELRSRRGIARYGDWGADFAVLAATRAMSDLRPTLNRCVSITLP